MDMKTAEILPAAWNPRSHADDVGLKELTASIERHGVIQPIVVRRTARGVEVVAGSRRLEGAQRAGLVEVPVIERELDDVAAAEVAMAENIQDEAMPPLDEAAGYQHLIEHGQLPVNEVARRLGIPVSRVRRRLRLLDLSDDVRTALASDQITLAHADRLVRLPAHEQQNKALQVCRWPSMWREDAHEPAPVAQLEQWMGRHHAETFDAETVVDYFPELAAEHEPEAVPTLLKLSTSQTVNADLENKKHGVIGQGRWVPIGGRDWNNKPIPDCEHSQEGVIVHGSVPRIIKVCAKKGCPVHRPPAPKAEPGGNGGPVMRSQNRSRAMTQEQQRQAEAAERERADRALWAQEKNDILAAFIEHTAGLPLTVELLREAAYTTRAEQLLARLLPEYELTMENMAQALAVRYVQDEMWDRAAFKTAAAKFGFKMPRRKATKKKAEAKKTTRPRAGSRSESTETGGEETTLCDKVSGDFQCGREAGHRGPHRYEPRAEPTPYPGDPALAKDVEQALA